MSSSSESEDDALLREALAPGFTMEAVTKQQLPVGTSKKENSETAKKSLRYRDDEDNMKQSNLFHAGVSITPQQQKFIASKLEEFLDREVKEVDLLTKAWEDRPLPKKKQKVRGVRLLFDSKKSLKHVASELEEPCALTLKPEPHKRRKVVGDEEGLSRKEKLRAAAVSPEWVLQGKGVYGKTFRRDGEVITGAVHGWTKK